MARVRIVAPVLGLLALLAAMLIPATVALAHPLDEFPQLSYITVTPTEIVVELDVTPGVLLAADTLAEIDTDGDQVISDAEGLAYVESIVGQLVLQVDGETLDLTLTSYTVPPYLNVQAGYGQIEIITTADLPASIAASSSTHQITYTNGFSPPKAKYQVNTFVNTGDDVSVGTQERSDDQQTLNVAFAIGGEVAQVTDTSSTTASSDVTGRAGALLAYIEQPSLSPLALALAMGLAVLLGGLHALTPGHGKTLVAAYLVGSRGTVRHAAALGATVTVTHTASVVAIGLLALFASHLIVPEVLVPSLEIASGLLVVILGGRLAWQRWRALRGTSDTAPHQHAAMPAGFHHHGDGNYHSHTVPTSKVDARSLVAMGVSGGLVPCPEALGIMILAVGLNHIVLGLGLIVAFSFGLATVLIGIGIALVRSRSLLDRVGNRGGFIQRWLPLVSALVVLVLGIGLVAKAIPGLPTVTPGGGPLLVVLVGLAGLAIGVTLALAVTRRRQAPAPAGSNLVPLAMLPPRYRDGHAVSSAPMGAAILVYDTTGAVAWDRIWGHDDPDSPFCDLALAGGPPHRGTLLTSSGDGQPDTGFASDSTARAEIARGIRMVTGLPVTNDVAAGWIGLVCTDRDMASWLALAIAAENVDARQDGSIVLLPADPAFRLDREVKNVVTATAKTFHYWSEHRLAPMTA